MNVQFESRQMEVNHRRPFDIHPYSMDVIDWLRQCVKRDGDRQQYWPFAQFVRERHIVHKWEVCARELLSHAMRTLQISRYFLATLMITNSEHIEINAAESGERVNSMRLRLLHDDRPVGRFDEEQPVA